MILQRLRSEKKIYPLFCILQSLLTFFIGLALVRQTWFWAYLAVLLLIHFFFGYAYTILRVIPVFVLVAASVGLVSLAYAEPLQALQAGYRVLLIGVSAIPSLSMSAMDLVRNFNQIKVPRWLTLGFLIALRFTRIMASEVRRIRNAIRLRGASAAWYRPSVAYRAFILPLVVRIMNISDLLAVSLETRGFRMDGETTQYKSLRLRGRDFAFALSILVFCGAALLLAYGGLSWLHQF